MKITLPVLAMLALAAGTAQAHDSKPGFDAYDKNNDGVISKSEAIGHPRLGKRFDAIDRNNDGRITRPEWLASRAKPKTAARKPANSQDARFSSLDRNKDGVLNRSEARGHLDRSASTGR